MERLQPLEKLESDYYLDQAREAGPDSEEEMSSDDELQKELKKIAGISTTCLDKKGKRLARKCDFESDMDDELDRGMSEYANQQMTHNMENSICQQEFPEIQDDLPDLEKSDGLMDCDDSQPSTSLPLPPLKSCMKRKSPQKKQEVKIEDNASTDDDEEENPIKKLARNRKKEVEEEPPEFYDEEEDDDNERWVQEQNIKRKGGNTIKNKTTASPSKKKSAQIDNGSDAVLSCPGCMCMLSRDCQRHEIYKDQYRAIFVENCNVDMKDRLTIGKTGKEKRKEKAKLKKLGVDMEAAGVHENPEDVFHPVSCNRCGTKVAVLDHEEIYHFFNVLSGYA